LVHWLTTVAKPLVGLYVAVQAERKWPGFSQQDGIERRRDLDGVLV
jgi:hypothetical protein